MEAGLNTLALRALPRHHVYAHHDAYPTRTPITRALPYAITPTGLVYRRGLTSREWQTAQFVIKGTQNAGAWSAGQWWVDVNKQKGETFAFHALDHRCYEPGTVKNYATLVRKFPVETRLISQHITYYQATAPLDLDVALKLLKGSNADNYHRADLRKDVTERKRKCPECGGVMVRDNEDRPQWWVCRNRECEHSMPYEPNTQPDTQKLTLTWDSAIEAFKPSVAPKLWAQENYSFEVTLREKAA